MGKHSHNQRGNKRGDKSATKDAMVEKSNVFPHGTSEPLYICLNHNSSFHLRLYEHQNIVRQIMFRTKVNTMWQIRLIISHAVIVLVLILPAVS